MKKKIIVCGDCIDKLKNISDNSIDVIYNDPPYFTGKKFRKGKNGYDDDLWNTIEEYIEWYTKIVKEYYRVLKPTGVIFIQADYRAIFEIKVLVMDKIFGRDRFLNDIVWHYRQGARCKKPFAHKHDTVLFYSKTESYHFDYEAVSMKPSKDKIKEYSQTDKFGRHFRTKYGRRYYLKNTIRPDVITDVAPEPANKRYDWPTQKPIDLLLMLLKATTKPGYIILDPMCGCGTALEAAERLGLNWVGIDIDKAACKIVCERLNKLTSKIEMEVS